jgi:CCR4-NOT transcription complex subunit 6
MYNRVMTRDNIALVARLQMLLGPASWTELLVTNVHIHWDPSFKDVKLVQAIMLAEELERIIANIYSGMGKIPMIKRKEIGVIVCGDFNSLPNSGVHAFLTNGGIGPKHPDFQNHTYEPYSNDGSRNGLNLRSAYSFVSSKLGFTMPTKRILSASSSLDELGDELSEEEEESADPLMPFTNMTPQFQGCIDYIYYGSEGPLVVTGALGGLAGDYVKQLVGFPTPHFPSDHLSLLVEFKVDEGSAREIITANPTTTTSTSKPTQSTKPKTVPKT